MAIREQAYVVTAIVPAAYARIIWPRFSKLVGRAGQRRGPLQMILNLDYKRLLTPIAALIRSNQASDGAPWSAGSGAACGR